MKALARATVAATFALVVAGGSVTSTGSGLAVPDWPTTFGVGMFDYPLAAMRGGVVFEHTHRLIASIVGLMTAVLAIWVGLREARRAPRALAAAALGLVVVQGLLGGATVLLGLPAWTSIAHAVLGQTFLAVVVALAASIGGKKVAGRGGLAAATAFAVWVQLVLGAILRHTGEGLGAHAAGAVAVALLAHAARDRLVIGLVHLQILLGAVTWWRGATPVVATLHVAVGAAVLAAAVAAAVRAAPGRARVADFAALARHRLTALVVASAAASFFIAGGRSAAAFLHLIVGTALLAAGASVLNQWIEREEDCRMRRTQARPIPAGRVAPAEALRCGLALSLAGLVALLLTDAVTAALGAATAASYLGLYTPLKKVTSLNTLIGAVPGAIPVLMGWTAATGRIEAGGWILFGILYLWQIPHFLAIATRHRDDYRAAGFVMLPAIDPDAAARQIVVFTLALLPVSLMWRGGPVYLVASLVLGLAFLLAPRRHLLPASIVYLPTLLGAMVLERIVP